MSDSVRSENLQLVEQTLSTKAPLSVPSKPSSAIFWLRIVAQAMFGSLLILDSLFLVLCYVTFNFFGVLNNHLLGWVRSSAHIAWLLYFPAFAIVLLSTEKRARKPAGAFIILQFAAGFALFFSRGIAVPLGWCLLYGPDLQTPAGNLYTYVQAAGCLFPLLWISGIHIATAQRATARQTEPDETRENRAELSSFLLAGAAAALIYAGSATIRLGIPAISFTAVVFSLAIHVALFTAAFLVLQWIRVFSHGFHNSAGAELLMKSAAGWLLLALIVRKIIFALLGFNSHLADFYAAIFALAAVLLIVGLILQIRVLKITVPQINPAAGLFRGSQQKSRVVQFDSWPARALAWLVVLGLVYLFTTRLVVIDWEHILGSVIALESWGLLLWLFSGLPGRSKPYSWKVLSGLSVACICAVAVLEAVDSKAAGADKLAQYADSDPSFFVIEQFLRPVIHDESYSGFYAFLTKHANISPDTRLREITLSDTLEPTTSRKPDIFLFVIDAMRQDYLSPYNSSVSFTPAIQAFAQESVVFRHAYTPYAGTALAEPAIWSGVQEPHSPARIPGAGHTNLQQLLNVDGYRCYISYDEVLDAIVPVSSSVSSLGGGSSAVQLKEFGAIVGELESGMSKSTESGRPAFFYTQPANLHTLSLTLHGGRQIRPHPGFNDKYASALEDIDKIFGEFIAFLKSHGRYENSIVILTSDHGESLGEMGREGHVSSLTPEVMRIPLIIHVPSSQQSKLVWDPGQVVTLHDITPTLYYLLGHHQLRNGPMIGHPLFTLTQQEQRQARPDHYFLMSSYLPVFGILSGDEKSLFVVDATLRRNYFYDLANDPGALNNRINASIHDKYEPLIRRDLEAIDRFYDLRILRLAGQAALNGEYATTIGIGLTPGGWLAVIGASNVTSSLTKPNCGCK